ncbi:hypothetical protein ONZ51_g7558 [Trametes cubensis]|uniref:Uncharacterized protein n=1 Tax=Trametes cubensis TaxID=1111947 RepID=A0AAD7TPX4_9APHY|nr:hypothetical protein ONZ51_g7558 [Trametes cubensis]
MEPLDNIGEDSTSDWIYASVSIIELRNLDVQGQRAHWGVGIHPSPPHQTVVIDLMTNEWTLELDENMKVIVFYHDTLDGARVGQCVRVEERAAMLKLVSLCAGIKMFKYTGSMMV